VTIIIPRVYTYYVSTALFAIFGLRMLKEGLAMSPDEGQDELEVGPAFGLCYLVCFTEFWFRCSGHRFGSTGAKRARGFT